MLFILESKQRMDPFANVLNQITGNIKRGPIHQKDLEFLQLIPQNKMADPIPHTLETMTIDLLVGSDYFWDVVCGDKIMLPSGILCCHRSLVTSLQEDVLRLIVIIRIEVLLRC